MRMPPRWPHPIFHKENGGESSARNLGLDNTRGECFLWTLMMEYVPID